MLVSDDPCPEIDHPSGDRWQVDAATVRFTHAALHPCDPFARSLFVGLIPTAHAHAGDAVTDTLAPVVLDLLTVGDAALGVLRPTPGDWCAIGLGLGPGRAPTLQLSVTPDLSDPFELESEVSRYATLPLDPPLHLEHADDDAPIEVRVSLRQWAEALPVDASGDALGPALMGALEVTPAASAARQAAVDAG